MNKYDALIDRLALIADRIKPEPAMNGPRGGHVSGRDREEARLAIEAAILALQAASPATGEGLREALERTFEQHRGHSLAWDNLRDGIVCDVDGGTLVGIDTLAALASPSPEPLEGDPEAWKAVAFDLAKKGDPEWQPKRPSEFRRGWAAAQRFASAAILARLLEDS